LKAVPTQDMANPRYSCHPWLCNTSSFPTRSIQLISTGWRSCLRHCATSRKVAG